jgi:hypothetical protein
VAVVVMFSRGVAPVRGWFGWREKQGFAGRSARATEAAASMASRGALTDKNVCPTL